MVVHSARIQGFHFRDTNFYIQMSRPEKDLNMNSRMTWLRNDPQKSVLVSTSERCCQTLFVFIHQASGIRHLKLTSRSWPPTTTPRHGGLNPPVPSNFFIIEKKKLLKSIMKWVRMYMLWISQLHTLNPILKFNHSKWKSSFRTWFEEP